MFHTRHTKLFTEEVSRHSPLKVTGLRIRGQVAEDQICRAQSSWTQHWVTGPLNLEPMLLLAYHAESHQDELGSVNVMNKNKPLCYLLILSQHRFVRGPIANPTEKKADIQRS
jgi:hypothetical protein